MKQTTTQSIFLADDNPDNLGVLTDILESAGYATRASLNGQDIIASLDIEKPDLVILDVHMPGMDGYEVCKRLKASAEWKNIPVIFCSALDEEFNVVKAFDTSGVDYVTKPFRPKEVLARVRTHLALKQREAELQESLSQLKAVQSHLVQTEKMKSLGVLMAGIAHEVNNPVNYIISSLNGLEKGLNDIRTILDEQYASGPMKDRLDEIDYPSLSNEVDALLQGIQDGARKVHTLVRSLRTFTQAGGSGSTAANVRENLSRVLSLVQAVLPDRCHIETDIPDIPAVRISANELAQVLLSVLSNAIDAVTSRLDESATGNPDGIIAISARPEQRINGKELPVVRIVITDNGVGMDSETLSHATDPFYTTKAPGHAVGLGLTSCYRMIHDAGGNLELTSTPDEGTVVTITLPVEHTDT